ncbi:hypothetical protein GO491_11895 [Flavobacteriaceae bacterium Ap0902]|nr:hypothetical protein [Flavobacteriaceae bacterium Ap0902]
MKPVNSKSLLAFTFGLMEKLENGEVDNDNAKTQTGLIKQANNLLRYELDRAKVKIQLSEHNKMTNDNLELREIESKNF